MLGYFKIIFWEIAVTNVIEIACLQNMLTLVRLLITYWLLNLLIDYLLITYQYLLIDYHWWLSCWNLILLREDVINDCLYGWKTTQDHYNIPYQKSFIFIQTEYLVPFNKSINNNSSKYCTFSKLKIRGAR